MSDPSEDSTKLLKFDVTRLQHRDESENFTRGAESCKILRMSDERLKQSPRDEMKALIDEHVAEVYLDERNRIIADRDLFHALVLEHQQSERDFQQREGERLRAYVAAAQLVESRLPELRSLYEARLAEKDARLVDLKNQVRRLIKIARERGEVFVASTLEVLVGDEAELPGIEVEGPAK